MNKVTSPYNESRQSPKRLEAIRLPHCSSSNRRKKSTIKPRVESATPKPRLEGTSRMSKLRIKRIVETPKISQASTEASGGSHYNFSRMLSPQNCRYGQDNSFDISR